MISTLLLDTGDRNILKELFFILGLLLSLCAFPQEKRLALVIGNSAYEYGGVLKNPVIDAFTMKQALVDLGFKVNSIIIWIRGN